MICEMCNLDKDNKDFYQKFNNMNVCYKCCYEQKFKSKQIKINVKKCLNCNKEITIKRKYCSDDCLREATKRKKLKYWTFNLKVNF